MTARSSDHYRTKVHPLFSLYGFSPTFVLRELGVPAATAVRLFIGAVGGLWFGALFLTLIFAGSRRTDAVVFCCLAGASSSVIFIATIPETFFLGSLSIVAVMAVTALAERISVSRLWMTVANAFSLSVTVTNWMVGILSALVLTDRRRGFAICRDAFLVVTLIWAVQKAIFKTSEFFLVSREEANYVFHPAAGGILDKIEVFVFHGLVMPVISMLQNPGGNGWPVLSVQHASLASHNSLGMAAVILWSGLLLFGGVTIVRGGLPRRFSIVLAGALAGQFLLHLIYGDETFLYSLHWAPLLVIVCAAGARSRQRMAVVLAAAALAVTAGANNYGRFLGATALLDGQAEALGVVDERTRLLKAIEANPRADWPRGTGHVILGEIGAPLALKGYHEPGGSFSPGFGSFGISIALFDPSGALVASSNRLPVDEIEQSLREWERGRYAIQTRSARYDAEWSVIGPERWRLTVGGLAGTGLVPAIRITSAGPAGGPLQRVRQDGRVVSVNDKWRVTFASDPLTAGVQPEGAGPRPPGAGEAVDFRGPDGFAAVSFGFPAGAGISLDVVRDGADTTGATAIGEDRPGAPAISVPDRRFAAGLEAQIAHLKMSLVGAETRPGDPANYPLEWFRAGAYTVVALARSGAHDLARRLVQRFADHDFFGGFAAEADAPGLAIWAIEEVASRQRDRAFDRKMWPHVLRKAAVILEMNDARRPVFKPFSGPIVPKLRNRKYSDLGQISRPAQDGLIVGKMDNHYPVLFVSAVNYLGLIQAAQLAARIGDDAKAALWRSRAGTLQQAWRRAILDHPDRSNGRTRISGLWPSGILKRENAAYTALLDDNWGRTRTADGGFKTPPVWTYFDLAETHQWLRLGRTDRVWGTLEWFWNHQASPGLYSWSEGRGEENTFNLWPSVRGWVRPRHVSPHYWTAAEMLLLQLEMLAHDAPGGQAGPCRRQDVVIGAGVPKGWLSERVEARGLSLRCGVLGWVWDGKAVTVTWTGGGHGRFVLGPAFPPKTALKTAP